MANSLKQNFNAELVSLWQKKDFQISPYFKPYGMVSKNSSFLFDL
jgi:hypothetical protein